MGGQGGGGRPQSDNTRFYKLLGVEKDASESEIKKAYRRASMKWHPDKHQQNKDALARANTTFKRLNEANQVLGDAYAKMMYDAELEVATASRYTNAHAKHDARQKGLGGSVGRVWI